MDGRTPDSALPKTAEVVEAAGWSERSAVAARMRISRYLRKTCSRVNPISTEGISTQQLADLSAAMTNAVSELAGGSEVLVSAIECIPIFPYRTAFLWVLPVSRQVRRECR